MDLHLFLSKFPLLNDALCNPKKKNLIEVVSNDLVFNGGAFNKLAQRLNAAVGLSLSYGIKKCRIKLKCQYFNDDATVINFEMLLAYLLENAFNEVEVRLVNLKNHIYFEYFKTSLIYQHDCILKKDEYLDDFYRTSNMVKNCQRFFLKYEQISSCLPEIMSAVKQWMEVTLGNKNFAVDVAKTVTEMIDNVKHAQSDCIVSIKINDNIINKEEEKEYNMISLCVVNVGDITVYQMLKKAIENNCLIGKTKEIVDKSLNNHKNYFNETYNIDNYCMFSILQQSVTTRREREANGGIGFIDMIKTLTKYSRQENCYLMSGDYCIYFKKKFLTLNDDGTIGFNEMNDYYNAPPSIESYNKMSFFYSGTIVLFELLCRKENL